MTTVVLVSRVYAGVVDYPAGSTVVWSLAWAQTAAGYAPLLLTDNLPAGTAGVELFDPLHGGARGTATLTATIDGVAVAGGLTATVPEPPSIGWMDPIGSFGGTVAHENSGTGAFNMNMSRLVAGVVGYTGGVVVWSLEWTPLGSDPAPPLVEFDDSIVSVDLPSIGFAATSKGQGLLSATVDGVATDAVEFATSAGSYSPVAWGPAP